MSSQRTPLQRIRLRVYGRVQGVFFRATACEVARELGITGWVRNCPDGSVELVAEGPPDALDKLRAWSRRGPPGAFVSRVEETASPAQGDLKGFSIRG
jgi:acylphosphatase